MIVWLHGAFGGGKTSVAAELRRRRSDLVSYDPEFVGYLVRRSLPVPSGDFQDLPEWRQLVVATGSVLDAGGTRTLVTPMTLLREDYAREIAASFSDRGVEVVHVLLDAAVDELRRRIEADQSPEHGDAVEEVRAWRRNHLEPYAAARPWLTRLADVVVDTTTCSVAEATEVLAALPD